MRALTFQAEGDVKVTEVPKPAIKSSGDALVKVTLGSVCGSDLHILHGHTPMNPGAVLGHEFVGVVEDVGSEVKRFHPGDRVVSSFFTSCGHCVLCRKGWFNQCVDKATFGSPAKYTWFFAERQEQSPWPSWVERSGAAGDSSTVTVFGAGGFLNLMETTSSADQLLDAFALSMAAPNNNDHLLCGEPLLVLCPEHARVLSSGGYSVDAVEHARSHHRGIHGPARDLRRTGAV